MTDKTLEERIKESIVELRRVAKELQQLSWFDNLSDIPDKTRYWIEKAAAFREMVLHFFRKIEELDAENKQLKEKLKIEEKKYHCILCNSEFISLTETVSKFCSPDCEVESENKVSEKLPEVGGKYKNKHDGKDYYLAAVDCEFVTLTNNITGFNIFLKIPSELLNRGREAENPCFRKQSYYTEIMNFWNDFEEIEEQPAQR